MFASNVTPQSLWQVPGIGIWKSEQIYLIQMAMLFAGVATIFQTMGFGPVGARMPIMQGTSFAFVGVLAGISATQGLGVALTAHHRYHPLCTGFCYRTHPLSFPATCHRFGDFGDWSLFDPSGYQIRCRWRCRFPNGGRKLGSLKHWTVALTVIVVALLFKFKILAHFQMQRSLSACLRATQLPQCWAWSALRFPKAAGLQAFRSYHTALNSAWVQLLRSHWCQSCLPLKRWRCISNSKGRRRTHATDEEIAGATYADGLGTAVAGVFGGLPNTSFSQNVGIVGMTGVMSRHVVTIAGVILVIFGLLPKIGALIASMPLPVLGGGVIVMFGMVLPLA